MPYTQEYNELVMKLFCGNAASDLRIGPRLTVVCANRVHIEQDVWIMDGCLMMAAGGITIKKGVRMSANVQLLTNNHDLYHRDILLCKPITLEQGCWIGAGATVLPGVTVGENAIVGAASVVTKDVPPNAIVVGNPAKVVRMIPEKGN